MDDGGCQMAVSAVVNIAVVILHPLSSKMFSTAAALRHRPTVVLVAAVSSSCGGVLLNPDDDNKDDDNCSHQDRTTGMWALCQGTSTIATTPMRR
jgi:hypothetical protein